MLVSTLLPHLHNAAVRQCLARRLIAWQLVALLLYRQLYCIQVHARQCKQYNLAVGAVLGL
jgi:hypothetical protein